MFMRKGERGQPVSWSGLKFVVIGSWFMFWIMELLVVILNRPTVWNEWSVKALAAILFTLVLDTVAALIPFPQILTAIEKGVTGASQIVANKAGEIKDKIIESQSRERIRSGPDVVAIPTVPVVGAAPKEPVHEPHEWADGDPHEGLG